MTWKRRTLIYGLGSFVVGVLAAGLLAASDILTHRGAWPAWLGFSAALVGLAGAYLALGFAALPVNKRSRQLYNLVTQLALLGSVTPAVIVALNIGFLQLDVTLRLALVLAAAGLGWYARRWPALAAPKSDDYLPLVVRTLELLRLGLLMIAAGLAAMFFVSAPIVTLV